MSEEKAITPIEIKTKLPAIQEAVDQYNMMVEYVQKVMKDGIDYGKVPGSEKPTLLKPGAEKLQRLFRLHSTIETMEIKEDWDKPFFYYRYKCHVFLNGEVLAECEGSANSYEKKYRYRYLFDNEITEAEKVNAVSAERISKKTGRAYTSWRVENKEPFDIVNTLQKMAQKRAYVGAILLAANASEFFTQDIEDLDIIDVEVSEIAKPNPTKPTAKSSIRPLAPDKLAEMLAMKADIHRKGNHKAADNDRKKLIANLNTLVQGDDNLRHELTEYLVGQQSVKDLDDGNVLALNDWLGAYQADTGEWLLDAMAWKEYRRIVEEVFGNGSGK